MDADTAPETREERFCRAYVRLPLALKAAAFAGYDPAEAEEAVHRLLTREDIQDRIALLRHEQARRQCHHVDAMLSKLQALFEQAMETQQLATALRALTWQARIAVLVDDRDRSTQRRREPVDCRARDDLAKQVGAEPPAPDDATEYDPDSDVFEPEPEALEVDARASENPVAPCLRDGGDLNDEGWEADDFPSPRDEERMLRIWDAAAAGEPADSRTPAEASPESRPIPLHAGASTAWPSDRTSVSRAATLVSKNTSFPSTHKCVVSSSPG